MGSYLTYTALIIEPSATKRSYLWQATLSEPSFSKVKGMKTLEESLVHLQEGNVHSVILIPSTFKRQQIANFIEKSKDSYGGKEAAYVLVLPDDDNARETIALAMTYGMDGFLFSPFTVESLKEVAKIAASVKKRFDTEKRKASLQLLLPQITSAIDAVALLKQKGKDVGDKGKSLKSQSENLKEIAQDFRDIYIDMLTKACEQAKPRQIPLYQGASKRVKQMLIKGTANVDSEDDKEISSVVPKTDTLTE